MRTFDVGDDGDTIVTVESSGADPDDAARPGDPRAYRQRYAYSIVTPDWRYDGDDIQSGCGADVDEDKAARTLFSFLGAAAESYRHHGMQHVGENGDLFPAHVTEWAYMNDDEIGLLSLEEE